jgi:hypothetical protein
MVSVLELDGEALVSVAFALVILDVPTCLKEVSGNSEGIERLLARTP